MVFYPWRFTSSSLSVHHSMMTTVWRRFSRRTGPAARHRPRWIPSKIKSPPSKPKVCHAPREFESRQGIQSNCLDGSRRVTWTYRIGLHPGRIINVHIIKQARERERETIWTEWRDVCNQNELDYVVTVMKMSCLFTSGIVNSDENANNMRPQRLIIMPLSYIHVREYLAGGIHNNRWLRPWIRQYRGIF